MSARAHSRSVIFIFMMVLLLCIANNACFGREKDILTLLNFKEDRYIENEGQQVIRNAVDLANTALQGQYKLRFGLDYDETSDGDCCIPVYPVDSENSIDVSIFTLGKIKAIFLRWDLLKEQLHAFTADTQKSFEDAEAILADERIVSGLQQGNLPGGYTTNANQVREQLKQFKAFRIESEKLLAAFLLHETGHIHYGHDRGKMLPLHDFNGKKYNVEPTESKKSETDADTFAAITILNAVRKLDETQDTKAKSLEMADIMNTFFVIGFNNGMKKLTDKNQSVSDLFDISLSHEAIDLRILRMAYAIFRRMPEAGDLAKLFQAQIEKVDQRRLMYSREHQM